MPSNKLVKFSSQVAPEVLEALKMHAKNEGLNLHIVLDEAFQDYLIKKSNAVSHGAVIRKLTDSIQEFDQIYRTLAK